MSPPNKNQTGRERLLTAAQHILSTDGLVGLNSNAVVGRAGVTPPTFYHYYKNKHALLRELGERMMAEQGEVLRADTGLQINSADDLYAASLNSVAHSLRATREFTGGYALLVSLRALPELRDVRLKSHQDMAELLADYFIEQGFNLSRDDLIVRARLGIEFGYAAIELLFETDFTNEQQVLERTARSIVAIYDAF